MQRGLHFQHDLSASSRDQRNIPHELERVPETLFGIKQNALTSERLAFPSALDQLSVIANSDLQAGFIFRPAGSQITLQQMNNSQIGSCLGGVGLQGAQAVKAIGGFGHLAQSVKNESQIRIGGNELGVKFYRITVGVRRRDKIALALEKISEAGDRLGTAGIQPQGAAESIDRGAKIAQVGEHETQVVVYFVPLRIESQGALVQTPQPDRGSHFDKEPLPDGNEGRENPA